MSQFGTLQTAPVPPPLAEWNDLPGGMVSPEADLLVVPRPRIAARLDDDSLVAALVETEAMGRRVDALRTALAAEAAERSRRELGRDGLAKRRGCRTAVELLQRTTGVSAIVASRRIRLGTATRAGETLTGAHVPPRFPTVALALEEGLLGVDAAVALIDTLGPCDRTAGSAAVAAAEGEIVAGAAAPIPDAAPSVDADGVRLQATVWRAVLDPDGAAPSAADVERRGLLLGTPRHGLVPVSGMLLPDVAGSLRRYADAWTNPRTPDVPGPDGCEAPGGCEAVSGGAAADAAADSRSLEGTVDRRSRAQVLHDVLATALTVAARAVGAPSVAGSAPTLVVTVRREDLAAARGVAWVDDLPVDLAVARHTACAGAVELVALGRSGRIVGLGSRERCFTGQQRRAIAVRDGTCVIPGCHVPAGWCEVHHVTPHAHDPDGTHTDNGVLLCWFHHRTLDDSGWEVRIRGGLPEVRPPRWLDPDRGWRAVR